MRTVLGPKLAARVLPNLVSWSEREVMLASVKIFTSRSALDARIRDRDLGRNQPELEDIVMDASTRIGGSKIPHTCMVWKEVAHLERRSRGMERMWLFHEDIELLQSLREQVERVCSGDSRK